MTPEEILKEVAKVIGSKKTDYTTSYRYENFDRQAVIMNWFESPIDKVFACMIAVKLARLAALLREGKTPKHESVHDTFVDLNGYTSLWAGYHEEKE